MAGIASIIPQNPQKALTIANRVAVGSLVVSAVVSALYIFIGATMPAWGGPFLITMGSLGFVASLGACCVSSKTTAMIKKMISDTKGTRKSSASEEREEAASPSASNGPVAQIAKTILEKRELVRLVLGEQLDPLLNALRNPAFVAQVEQAFAQAAAAPAHAAAGRKRAARTSSLT